MGTYSTGSEPYPNWERFKSEVQAIAGSFARLSDDDGQSYGDIIQAAWTGLFCVWSEYPDATDETLKYVAYRAAREFVQHDMVDGPHNASGYRDGNRMVPLDGDIPRRAGAV